MFSLLKPTFSLPIRPHLLTLMLHPRSERSPTKKKISISSLITFLFTASADSLVPFIFGARALDQ